MINFEEIFWQNERKFNDFFVSFRIWSDYLESKYTDGLFGMTQYGVRKVDELTPSLFYLFINLLWPIGNHISLHCIAHHKMHFFKDFFPFFVDRSVILYTTEDEIKTRGIMSNELTKWYPRFP